MIRTARRVLLFLVAGGALLLVGALVALHAGADTWAVNSLVRRVIPGATTSVADVAGNYFSAIELRDVLIVQDAGAALLRCDTVRVRYDLRQLLSGNIALHRVQLIGPVVTLHQSSNGSWNPFPSRARPAARSPSRAPAVTIEQFSIIGGTAGVRPAKLQEPLAVRFAGEGSLAGPRLMVDRLVLQSDSSSIAGRGWITLSRAGEPLNLGAVNLDVEATPLAYRDLRGFHSGPDREGSVRLKGRIRGDGSRANVTLEVAPSTGGTLDLKGELTPPKRSPMKYRLDAVLHGFDVGPFLGRQVPLQPIDGKIGINLGGDRLARLNGKVRVELSDHVRSLRANAELDQGRVQVELLGKLDVAVARISGRVSPFDSVLSYDLRAQVQPTYKGRANAGYIRWLGESGRSVAIRIRGHGLPPDRAVGWATARIDSDSSGTALLDSGSVAVRLNGQSAQLVARAGVTDGLVTASGTAAWGSNLRLRIHRGTLESLELAALLGDTSWTALNGTFSVDLDFLSGVMQLAARSQLNDAALNLKAHGSSSGRQRTLVVPQLSFKHVDLSRFRSNQTNTDLNGSGSIRASGRNLKTALITGQLQLEDSRIGREALRRAQLAARLEHGAIHTRGDIDARSGQLAFSGSARPFDSLPSYRAQEITFNNLDLGRLLKQERFGTRLAGSLSSEGIGRSAEDARLSGTLNLHRSTVDSTTIERGRIEATLKQGQLEIVGMLRGQRDSVLVGAALSPLEDHPRFTLITRVPISELASILQHHRKQDADGVAYLALRGEWGHPDSMKLQGELQAEGRLGDLRLDSLGATLQLREGVARLDSFSLRSNVASAAGSGFMGLFGSARSGPARLGLSGRFADLMPLAPYVGVADITLDSGTVSLGAEGTRDSLRLNLSMNARGLTTGEKSLGEVVGSARGLLAGNRLSSGTAELSARRIRSGKASLQSILLQGSSRGDEMDFRAEALIDSHNDARVVARVRRGDHGNQVQLDTLNARIDRNRWALSHPVRISYGDRIRVDDFVFASGPRRIAVNGVIDRRGEQAFQVKIDYLRLQQIAQALGLGELGGELNMSANLTGPARSPNFHGEWDVAVRARNHAVGTASGRAEWRSDGLVLDAKVAPVKSDSLTLKGRLPLALSLSTSDSTHGLVTRIPGGELAFDAVGPSIDVRKFEPLLDEEKMRDLRGKLSVNAHARGTLDAPQLSGNIILREAKIRLPSVGTTYKAQLKLDLKGQQARVTQARIEAGKGRVDLTGSIGMGTFPVTLDLTSQLRDFRAASAEELRTSVSGNLHLRGDIKAPILTGALQLHNTDFYLQAKNLEHSAEAVELTPENLKVLEQRFGPEVARRSRESRPPLYAWGLGLDVALSQNNWLRRRSDPVMAVELSGKVSVRKKPKEELQLFGQIQPLVGRSFVQLMSRRFDLKSGTFELAGPINQARLALNAEYSTTAAGSSTPVVIIAGVKSDTGKLDVSLVSRPMMPNADIISYLTTGRPASTDPTLESDEQGVLAAGASLAFGAALGSVAGRAGQSLGLDVVQVLQDRQGGQTVVAGKYVSPPLYLGFRQPIVPPSTSTRSTSQQQEPVEFEVEYAALRQMLLNLQGGGSDIRVFLRLRR